MRLVAVAVENFRAFGPRFEVKLDDLTILVGRNDVGKSSVLDAIGIFLEADGFKIEADDACKAGDPSQVRITCTFEDVPAEVDIDAGNRTSLADEGLLDANGRLQIEKVYDCTKSKITIGVVAVANHWFDAAGKPMLGVKIKDLKNTAKAAGVALEDLDKRKSAEIRRALREGDLSWDHRVGRVSLEDEDGKTIWGRLREEELPLYFVFRADRPSTDQDAEAQDPIKVAVTQALAAGDTKAKLEEVIQTVGEAVRDVTNRTLEKLRESHPDLASELKARAKSEKPDWKKLFGFDLASDQDVPLNKRGSGVRRLVLFNFFRAEAERRALAATAAAGRQRDVIYAIEEPETAQHPNSQRALAGVLRELSTAPRTQVLATTHAPGLASETPLECLRLLASAAGGVREQYSHATHGTDVVARVAASLGVLPDHGVKLFVCVEGPNDCVFLETISKILHEANPVIPSLREDARVRLVSVGGSTLSYWVRQRPLEGLGVPEFHLYDRDDADPPKYQAQVNDVNARNDGSSARLTGKREIENYLHPDAIAEAIDGHVVNVTDDCDVPALVAEKVHAAGGGQTPWAQLDDVDRKEKASKAKKRLCRDAAARMTAERLAERDAAGELRGWLTQIGQALL